VQDRKIFKKKKQICRVAALQIGIVMAIFLPARWLGGQH
jgi:hypothetical protein